MYVDECIIALNLTIVQILDSPDAKWTDQQNQEWKNYLIAFLEFRSLHGENAYPSKKSKDAKETNLAMWVRDQQNSYEHIKNGVPSESIVPKNLIDLLHQVKNFPLGKYHEELKRLMEYKVEHGHINVAVRDSDLGKFVALCRRKYKAGTIGSSLKAELDEMGFEWNMDASASGIILSTS